MSEGAIMSKKEKKKT